MGAAAPPALTRCACYPQLMQLVINGQPRDFPALTGEATVQDLLGALGLKQDRVAVEHNGTIVARASWPSTPIAAGDRFEIVHFVGGGAPGES
jgi:thiamine biosynthesis protein ThiS